MNAASGKIRIDKYLWSIRIFKTRSQATEACSKGNIKMNGQSVKASKMIELNDQYEIKASNRKWVIKVTGFLQQRVQYAEAVQFYLDITPVVEKKDLSYQAPVFHTGKRLSKMGRPTKKERRGLDDFFNS